MNPSPKSQVNIIYACSRVFARARMEKTNRTIPSADRFSSPVWWPSHIWVHKDWVFTSTPAPLKPSVQMPDYAKA